MMTNTALALGNFREKITTEEKIEQSTDRKDNGYGSTVNVNKSACLSDATSPNLEISNIHIDTVFIKDANRAIRSRISQEEYNRMIEERNALVLKEFKEGLTRSERTRIGMLRWQIEGIEDARNGKQLDKLEALVERQEHLGEMIRDFMNQAKAITSQSDRPSVRKSNGRKRAK